MAKILGVIGGGQLGLMLTEAANQMSEYISHVIVLDPTPNCPASKAGAKQIIADFKDEDAILELAEKSDIITYEIESGNSDVLKKLEDKSVINPSPETLKIIQDKLEQKKFLLKNKIPIAEFAEINNLNELKKIITDFGLPVLLKVRKDAYDGRGNYKISSIDAGPHGTVQPRPHRTYNQHNLRTPRPANNSTPSHGNIVSTVLASPALSNLLKGCETL